MGRVHAADQRGFIRRTIKPALGHLEVRKVRGPILDKLYTRRAAFWTHWISAKSIHFLCRPGGLSAWDHPGMDDKGHSAGG